jgi:hypothetical protein
MKIILDKKLEEERKIRKKSNYQISINNCRFFFTNFAAINLKFIYFCNVLLKTLIFIIVQIESLHFLITSIIIYNYKGIL